MADSPAAPVVVRRVAFGAWAGVLPAVAWAVWGRRQELQEHHEPAGGARAVPSCRSSRWALQIGALFLGAAVAVAAAREIPAMAALHEPARRRIWGGAYLSLRGLGLAVAAVPWRWRKPRSVAEVLVLVLGVSALVDIVPGIWLGDPWQAAAWKAVAWPVAGMTWGAVGGIMAAWVRAKRRDGG